MDKIKSIELLRERVLMQLDMDSDIAEERLRDEIRQQIIEYAKENALSIDERIELEKAIYNSLKKFDVLQDLLEDDEITEIMINGHDNIFVERDGNLIKTDVQFFSEEKLYDVIQQIVGMNNKVVNESSPIVDTRLMDGSRVNIILPPISVDKSIVTIRRFPKEPINMKKLISFNSISEEIVLELELLVKAKYNMFLSGGTGCGKTTFLNALTEFIPSDERVITIEDSAELQVQNVDNLVRLEARDATLDGRLKVSIRDLIRASLRQRPDRVIVGECRGEEALEVLQANNTGHDGSLSTGHANSTKDMISRLETMVLMGMDLPISAIRQQIASGIDIFIHLGRMYDGSRKLLEISEVEGITSGEVVLRKLWEYDGQTWIRCNQLLNVSKLKMNGFYQQWKQLQSQS